MVAIGLPCYFPVALLAWLRYQQLAMIILILVIGLTEWPLFCSNHSSLRVSRKTKNTSMRARVMAISSKRNHVSPYFAEPHYRLSGLFLPFKSQRPIVAEAALSFLGLGMPQSRAIACSLISARICLHVCGFMVEICVIPSVRLHYLILA